MNWLWTLVREGLSLWAVAGKASRFLTVFSRDSRRSWSYSAAQAQLSAAGENVTRIGLIRARVGEESQTVVA